MIRQLEFKLSWHYHYHPSQRTTKLHLRRIDPISCRASIHWVGYSHLRGAGKLHRSTEREARCRYATFLFFCPSLPFFSKSAECILKNNNLKKDQIIRLPGTPSYLSPYLCQVMAKSICIDLSAISVGLFPSIWHLTPLYTFKYQRVFRFILPIVLYLLEVYWRIALVLELSNYS